VSHVDGVVRAGGVFVALASVHFVADFVFQSHATAMAKHDHWRVRLAHCLVYGGFFVPLFVAIGWLDSWKMSASLVVLIGSHFIEDTYAPVVLWARHIRKPSEMMRNTTTRPILGGLFTWTTPDPELVGFREFIRTPLGAILMVSIDQIVHLTVLWFPAALAAWGD
jgi:hypothetical protein